MSHYLLHQSLVNLGSDMHILSQEAARLALRIEGLQGELRVLMNRARLDRLTGDQMGAELRRWVADTEDMPDLSDISVQAAPELLRIRFGRLVALLKENGILNARREGSAR